MRETKMLDLKKKNNTKITRDEVHHLTSKPVKPFIIIPFTPPRVLYFLSFDLERLQEKKKK